MKFQPLGLIISKLINEQNKKGLQNIEARLGMIYYIWDQSFSDYVDDVN